jgi:hypothetical protein
MERSILALLARHESVRFDPIVAHLAEPRDAARSALTDLRHGGLAAVLGIGENQGQEGVGSSQVVPLS